MEQVKQPRQFSFGAFEFNPRTTELRERDRIVALQRQPAEILLALLERPGELITREELVRRLWPDGTFVDFDRSLNKAVNKLREALRDSAEQPQFIETLPRRGYRFIAPASAQSDKHNVFWTHAPATVQSNAEPVPKSIETAAAMPAVRPQRRGALKIFTAAALALGTLIASGIAWYRFSRQVHKDQAGGFQIIRLTDNRKTEWAAISPDERYVAFAARDAGGLSLWLHQVQTRGSDIQIVPSDAADFAGLTFSPDSNYVYFVRGDKNDSVSHSLFATPVLGGPARLLLKGVDSPVSFSPDDQQLVYTRCAAGLNALELRTANSDGSADRQLAILPDAVSYHQSGPSWSTNGRYIAVSVMLRGKSTQWALEMVSVKDGTVRQIYSSPYKIGRPLWLPENDDLLIALDDQYNNGQLYLFPFPQGKPRRLTTDLSDYGDDRIDLARDGKTAAIVAWDESGDVWQASATDPAHPRQTESSGVALLHIAVRQDGTILATDLNNRLWIMDRDGRQRALFTDAHPADSPVICGDFVMFLWSTVQGDSVGLMRADADGTNVRRLVSEPVGSAACTSDSKFVFYSTEDFPPKIRKIPIEGGTPLDIAAIPGDDIESNLAISPDGMLLAYVYHEPTHPSTTADKLAVIPVDGGPPVKVINMNRGVSTLRWSPNSKALQYSLCIFCAGSSEIWEQPLSGGKPSRLTNFNSGRIFDFAWSFDRKNLILIRGDLNGDVVLLSHIR